MPDGLPKCHFFPFYISQFFHQKYLIDNEVKISFEYSKISTKILFDHANLIVIFVAVKSILKPASSSVLLKIPDDIKINSLTR